MRTIVSIVEGDSEVKALPILLRRLAEANGVYDLEVPVPIRVRRDQFIRRDEEFSRKVQLAAAKAGGGAVLILLDGDDDCPVALATNIADRARRIVPNVRLSVVIAQCEYEAWLLAGAGSLAGKRGLYADIAAPLEPESIRNAKGWLSERISNGRYHEVSDQPALTAVVDLEQVVARSRSFRKLVKEIERALT